MRDSSSSSSSSSSSWPWLHGHGAKQVVLCLVISLLLVSVMVLAFDSNTPTSWFSSYYYNSPNLSSRARTTGDALLVTSSSSSTTTLGANSSDEGVIDFHSSYASLPPAAPPSPAPAPEPDVVYINDSISDATIPLTTRPRRRDIKLQRSELDLAKARAAIREAVSSTNNRSALSDIDYVPQGPVYRNAYVFHRSYLEMEKLFKVYIYEEGEPPIFHDGPCRSIYSTEGRFIYAIEIENQMRTRDPELAHVHFLPFSVVNMVRLIYDPNSHSMEPLQRTVSDYINVISGKYPYWNRSLGADHFMLSCHDWGPHVSSINHNLFSNSIRVLCNANTSEGFKPSKDVSLPEINIKSDVLAGMIGGPSASHRPILAFFAGGNHGPVRPLLLKHWKDKDSDVHVTEYLPKGVSYYDMMRKSKYCLCPSGYEVASPRIVEAIYLECVPVTISDHYVLPFSDVLNWKAFSVQVSVEDIPNIKNILMSISPRQYIRMQRRLRVVRQHFMVNNPPKRFDVFYMILHSVWLRRLNIRIHQED